MKHFGEKGEWAYPETAQNFRVPPIFAGTRKATDLKFGEYIQRVHPNKSPLKIERKGSVGISRDCPNFLATHCPLLSQARGKLQISNLASTLRGSIGIKAMINFGEKGAWGYPGTVKNYRVPPIISGTGKATDFKFCQYIQRVHQNKSPIKILEKRERGRIQGLPNFFGYPLLSQERGKLRITNYACTFMASIRTEANEKFRKSKRVHCQGLLKFSGRQYVGRIARSSLFSINLKTVSYTHLTLPTKRIV